MGARGKMGRGGVAERLANPAFKMASAAMADEGCRPVHICISDFGVGKIKISRQVFTPLKRKPPLKSS